MTALLILARTMGPDSAQQANGGDILTTLLWPKEGEGDRNRLRLVPRWQSDRALAFMMAVRGLSMSEMIIRRKVITIKCF